MWSNLDTSMNTSGFLDTSHASTSSEDKGNIKRGQNVVPMMIGHLTNCIGEVENWGNPVHAINIVGIIRHIEEGSTKITYKIEDETDIITAFQWLTGEEQQPPMQINSYVRVHGIVREQGGKKHVLIMRILPMSDLNELVSHLLEVTYVTLKAEQMAITKSTDNVPMETQEISMSDNNYGGMSKEQALVFKIIESENDTETGIHKDAIKARIPKNILSRVDEIIDFLTSEGHIYTTCTEDYFKTT